MVEVSVSDVKLDDFILPMRDSDGERVKDKTYNPASLSFPWTIETVSGNVYRFREDQKVWK